MSDAYNEILQFLNNAYLENVRQINHLQTINANILETMVNEYNTLTGTETRHPFRSRQTATATATPPLTTEDFIRYLSGNLTGTNSNSRVQYYTTTLPLFRSASGTSDIPTATQIRDATFSTQFCNIIEPVNSSCSISLESFNPDDNVTIIRYCGHIFNPTNLMTWFQRHSQCPMCRYDIKMYNASQNINNFSLSDNSMNNLPLPTVPATSTSTSTSTTRRQTLNDSNTVRIDTMIDELLNSVFRS